MGIARQVQILTRGRQATTSRRAAGDQRLEPGRPVMTGPRQLVAGIPATSGHRLTVGGPRSVGDQWSPAGRGSTPAPVRLFQIFLIKKRRIFGSLGNGLGLLREWVYNTPII
jgi:hypothetical protein